MYHLNSILLSLVVIFSFRYFLWPALYVVVPMYCMCLIEIAKGFSICKPKVGSTRSTADTGSRYHHSCRCAAIPTWNFDAMIFASFVVVEPSSRWFPAVFSVPKGTKENQKKEGIIMMQKFPVQGLEPWDPAWKASMLTTYITPERLLLLMLCEGFTKNYSTIKSHLFQWRRMTKILVENSTIKGQL